MSFLAATLWMRSNVYLLYTVTQSIAPEPCPYIVDVVNHVRSTLPFILSILTYQFPEPVWGVNNRYLNEQPFQ